MAVTPKPNGKFQVYQSWSPDGQPNRSKVVGSEQAARKLDKRWKDEKSKHSPVRAHQNGNRYQILERLENDVKTFILMDTRHKKILCKKPSWREANIEKQAIIEGRADRILYLACSRPWRLA